jgi:sec-independent protein translocase protein TatB
VFDLSPGTVLVLVIIGILVVGPDRLPNLANDAARLLRTLREMANGAREQLRDELGPEFTHVDLCSLTPRAVIQRATFGDELDLRKLDPGNRSR